MNLRIDGKDTEVSGRYAVTAYAEEGTPVTGNFEVHPDSVDALSSVIETSGDVLSANGTDEMTVRAVIRDRYGNPVPSRRIELISSRPSDTVGALTGETDDRGEQLFSVRATEPGVVSLARWIF